MDKARLILCFQMGPDKAITAFVQRKKGGPLASLLSCRVWAERACLARQYSQEPGKSHCQNSDWEFSRYSSLNECDPHWATNSKWVLQPGTFVHRLCCEMKVYRSLCFVNLPRFTLLAPCCRSLSEIHWASCKQNVREPWCPHDRLNPAEALVLIPIREPDHLCAGIVIPHAATTEIPPEPTEICWHS